MRYAVVTGGTKGIGLAIARKLAADGCGVVSTYAHDDAAARSVEETAKREGLHLTARKCDVTDAAAVMRLFDELREPGTDILVHSAGFTRDKLLMMMPDSDFDEVVAVHLRGAF